MNCTETYSLFPYLLDGTLSPEKEKDLKEHMKVCSTCHKKWVSYSFTVRTLKELPRRTISPFFLPRLMERLPRREPFPGGWFVPAFGGVFFLFLLSLGFAYYLNKESPQVEWQRGVRKESSFPYLFREIPSGRYLKPHEVMERWLSEGGKGVIVIVPLYNPGEVSQVDLHKSVENLKTLFLNQYGVPTGAVEIQTPRPSSEVGRVEFYLVRGPKQ